MKKQTSRTLGILSIILGIFFPIVGLVLGIVGLSIKKTNYSRDVKLNTIGIIVSVLSWLIAIMLLLGY
jgi:Trk-type K+ transport system membrane component